MPLTPKEQETFIRLLGKSTHDPRIANIGTLAREHLVNAIEQIANIAKICPIPELRLKAAVQLVELSKMDTQDDAFAGDTEALTTLAALPQDQQRASALKMFAEGQIGRKDLDTVLKILDSGQGLQIQFLVQQNKYLETLLDEKNARQQARTIDNSIPPVPGPFPHLSNGHKPPVAN